MTKQVAVNSRFPLLVILLFPVLVCFVAWYFWFSPVTTVILVRHAERLNSSDTTSISEIGMERAQALAHVLRASGLTRVYVSEKARTLQTAGPTAAAFGVTPVQITANEAGRYADSVKAHRGDVILIVGHSDTIPEIIGKLGISSPPSIPSSEFDHLFVVSVFRFRSTLTHLKFGNPS
jgi:broad specificity phosphatase PhoE